MANSFIQLRGNLKMGIAASPVAVEDVSNYVSTMKIMTVREEVTIPATLGTGRKTSSAGTREDKLEITFHSSMKAAELWAILYEVIASDDSQLDFEGTFEAAVASADNPEYSGRATLLSLDTGADVGALRQQTITLPIASLVVAVS